MLAVAPQRALALSLLELPLDRQTSVMWRSRRWQTCWRRRAMCILWPKAACRCAPERRRPQLVGSCFSRPRTNSCEEKSEEGKKNSYLERSRHIGDLQPVGGDLVWVGVWALPRNQQGRPQSLGHAAGVGSVCTEPARAETGGP